MSAQGKPRTVVLIHGSPGAPAAWKGVARALGEGTEIVMPPLPDHGQPHPPPRRETAEIAAAIAAELGPRPEGVVLAGHSYGGNVALHIALSGALKVEALVLLEPVALGLLPVLGDIAAHAEAKAVFDGYIARGHAGEADAIATMIDFWFGAGAFARLPDAVRLHLVRQTAVNLRDVEATFRERYARAGLGALAMPVAVVFGSNSPPLARSIAERLAAAVANGRAECLAGADHGMLASHAPQIAGLIGRTAGWAAG